MNDRRALLEEIALAAPPWGRMDWLGSSPFGPALTVERFRLKNGLEVLICEDHSAPVVAYHTWFKVGSRHEKPGKTGLAHLFEHLMFRETESLPEGEYDRKLEEAGADNNAATWLDWTQYTINVPAAELPLVIGLEAERMQHLVLREPQVAAEKEVVANERRYRVDDDVEGAISEVLWSTAFTRHGYHWPTIGWMDDILGFTPDDCAAFYATYYAPNNATIVVSGDVSVPDLLRQIARDYGAIPPSELPAEDVHPEPPQTDVRERELFKPTATEKLAIGYHCPALGDFDHLPLTVLGEVLFGGRASRVVRSLIQEEEIATDARVFVGTFRDPGLLEIFLSARGEHSAEDLLASLDREVARVQAAPVGQEELDRARARFELGLIASLDTADGKASTLGFYDTVLGRPNAAFERLEALSRLTPGDLWRVARRWLPPDRRTVIKVRPSADEAAE